MRMKKGIILAAFVSGFLLAVAAVGLAMSYAPSSLFKQAVESIAACEATLPRDQHCIVTAVVAASK